MSRILITGGNGFIGTALKERLLKDKANTVVEIRRDKSKDRPATSDYIVEGDICDYDVCRRAIGDYEIEEVYHLASQSIVRVCANDPISAYQSNVMGTVNLLEACRSVGKNHVRSVLVSTSDKAYGHAPAPYTEDTPLQPKFTYESTKACQDIVAQNYFHNYQVPVKIARCSNVYGPGDPNWSRLIPNTIRRILNSENPVVYKDVASFTREFVYIDDIIDAFHLITKKAPPGESYCVGGVMPINIQALVLRIIDLMGSSLKVDSPKRAANFMEIQEQYIRGEKLKALGWQPKIDLQEGLRKTIGYYRDL